MMTHDQDIRTIEIPSFIGSSGIGYVRIPSEVDRDKFVAECKRTHTVTIWGGQQYGYFHDVSVDKNTIQEIIFPKEKGKNGSAVIWINIPVFNKPAVIGIFKYDDEFINLDEHEITRTVTSDDCSIEYSMNADTKVFSMSVNSKSKSNFVLKLRSNDSTSTFKVDSDSKIELIGDSQVLLDSNKEITLQIVDEELKDIFKLSYLKGVGLVYSDEFGNKIAAKKGEVNITSDSISHNSGKEKMVLGDTLSSLLQDILKQISLIVVPTAFGPSGTPVNAPAFVEIASKIETILSKKSSLE